jgi:hypothetical protein
VAWLIEKGFAYIADDSVVLTEEPGTIAGFPEPLALRPDSLSHLAGLPAFHSAPSLRATERLLVRPDRMWLGAGASAPCGLIINVHFVRGSDLHLEPIVARDAAFRLLEHTRRVIIPSDAEYATVAALAERVPALRLTYGSYAQIDGVLDFLARIALEAETDIAEFNRFLRGLPRPAPVTPPRKTYPIPTRTERQFSPKLTIGMATYDDFDGVYFSLQAIRMYHADIADQIELLVIDNHPDGPCGEPLKKLEDSLPNYRYIPFADTQGTTQSRDRVFAEAGGEFVLCMDCHVFIVPGAIRRLLDYFAANPETNDLLQGPIVYDDLKSISTHYEPRWQAGFYGVWGTDPAAADPAAPPFEVVIQGLGLFVARRAAWPGFNPAFRGFGGEEGYIHEKFRRRGHRTLCLPFLRWMHRFPRPMGIPYPNRWNDRIRNYIIGLREFGLPLDDLQAHYREVLGAANADELIATITRELDDVARQ